VPHLHSPSHSCSPHRPCCLQTITVACLFLGLKVAEHPKHLKHVIVCCEEYRFRSKSLSERARCENDQVCGRLSCVLQCSQLSAAVLTAVCCSAHS
jgi:hypothetical protein